MTTPEDRANEFLQPVIDDLATKAKGLGQGRGRAGGGKKRLAERLSELTGQLIRRERVEEWLRPDPSRRIQPRLGIGLLMREAWEAMNNGRETTKGKRKANDSDT